MVKQTCARCPRRASRPQTAGGGRPAAGTCPATRPARPRRRGGRRRPRGRRASSPAAGSPAPNCGGMRGALSSSRSCTARVTLLGCCGTPRGLPWDSLFPGAFHYALLTQFGASMAGTDVTGLRFLEASNTAVEQPARVSGLVPEACTVIAGGRTGRNLSTELQQFHANTSGRRNDNSINQPRAWLQIVSASFSDFCGHKAMQ